MGRLLTGYIISLHIKDTVELINFTNNNDITVMYYNKKYKAVYDQISGLLKVNDVNSEIK